MGSNTVAWASWGIVTPQPSVDGILLDPDFEKIGRSGRLWTRNEMIVALVADAAPEQHTIDIRDMSGRMIGPGLVLLTYVTRVEGRRARSSSLWRQSMKGWRVMHHQAPQFRRRIGSRYDVGSRGEIVTGMPPAAAGAELICTDLGARFTVCRHFRRSQS